MGKGVTPHPFLLLHQLSPISDNIKRKVVHTRKGLEEMGWMRDA
ncbi:hypothetical protein HMPREF9374_1452 [Desmospora sp. 8437]|nr:hypothetical protein HMPREF9374_1452 [Desmospora sp. 8437]